MRVGEPALGVHQVINRLADSFGLSLEGPLFVGGDGIRTHIVELHRVRGDCGARTRKNMGVRA